MVAVPNRRHEHPFDALMELPTEQIRLDCAALHLARDVYPDLNIETYLCVLEELAGRAADQRPGLSAMLRYEAIRGVLVEQFGLQGNTDDYYNPDNSYLNRVMERRVGVPIALAVIWLEVARRLKWPVTGVGFPGHFLVRFDDDERFVLVDPFAGGRSLSVDDCREMLQDRFDGKVKFSSELLEPVGTRLILARMLNNLRSIYLVNHDWQRLEATLHRLAAVEPENGQHLHELAALHYRQGNFRRAHAYLTTYLARRPGAEERPLVQETLRLIERAIGALN